MSIADWYAGVLRPNPNPSLDELALKNTFFRDVIITTPRKQWVLMNVRPGEEIGKEKHRRVKQTFYFVSGSATAIIDGKRRIVRAGDVITVKPGMTHNFITLGRSPLKLWTTYEPPNHIHGRIQKTKRAADLDTIDEAFGQRVDRGGR